MSSAESYLFLLLNLLHFLSSDKSHSLDDESDDAGSDSGSTGKCAFPFRFDDPVGHVYGVGFGVFFPIAIKSNCEVVLLIVFTPIGVNTKDGRPIEIFWCPKS